MVETSASADEILSTIRGTNHRVTLAKRTVVEVLVNANGHMTAEEITSAVQSLRPEVSPSTIYRILEELEDLDVVVHSHLGQAAAVYLTCEECKSTVEISGTHFDALNRDLQKTYGFQLDRHHVALSGTCAACQQSRRTSA
jgi:Fur family ferric uptake transcriptional regulator